MALTRNEMGYAIYILEAVAFLDLFAIGLLIPLVAGHVRHLGANHVFVGLMGSVYAGCQLGSGPLVGSLSDIKGRKTILIMTLLLCSVAYMLMGLTESIFVILAIRAFLGIFKQTQMLTKALVPDYEKNEEKQSIIYGKMAAISGVGITTGPIIGGHISEDNPNNGFTIIGALVSLCFVLNSCLVYLLPSTQKARKKMPKEPATKTVNVFNTVTTSMKQSVLELYKINWKQYWDVFLFKALVGFAMGVYYSNYALYLKTQYTLSPKSIGYVISFQGVIGSISSYCIGYLNSFYPLDNDYTLRNFHVFLLLTASLCGLSMCSNIYVYLLWLIPLAVGNSVGRLVTLEMVLKRSHGDHRGTLIGAANSVRSLSGVISPMVAGFIGQYLGVSYVIYASAAATFVGSFISYHVRRLTQKKQLKTE